MLINHNVIMTLREILKDKGIPYKVVSDALGIHPNNMPRYDDLMKRSVDDVLTISKATGIEPSELIGFSIGMNQPPSESDRMLSIIESQQRTIEVLAKSVSKSKSE